MKKKILIVIPSLRRGGGAERVISNLSENLTKLYDLYILTFNHFRDLYDFDGKYFTFNEKSKLWKKLLRPLKIYEFIRYNQVDLIISVMDHTNIITIITKLLFNIKIPLIVSNHANPKIQYKKNARYLNYAIKFFYRLNVVNKIITVSKSIQFILAKDYRINKRKLKTIYNGVDLERIDELSKNEILDYQNLFYNDKIIRFITVGRLHESKGHEYLIKAFANVIKKIPNSKLFIIGQGPLEYKLKHLIERLKIINDVILLGQKRDPIKYLHKSDIFVLSSIYEGLPLVLLEALACNLPIISSNCETGPKEILDHGKYGILTNVMDPEDLAKNMIILASNPVLLREFSEKSRERAKFFDMEKMNKKWVDLIESIVRKQD